MKLEQQVVSLELAKKMKELGFEQESLFYWIEKEDKNNILWHKELTMFRYDSCGWMGYSAYTVAELLEIIGQNIAELRPVNAGYEVMRYRDLQGRESDYSTDKTAANALAKMLIYLTEQGIITPINLTN